MIGILFFLASLQVAADPGVVSKDDGKTESLLPPTATADGEQPGEKHQKPVLPEQTSTNEDYTVLSSDLSGVTFVYRPKLEKISKLRKPKLDNLPHIVNCTWEDEAGRPKLPRRIFHIAVPTGFQPRVSAKAYDELLLGKIAIPLVPDYERVELDGIPTLKPIPPRNVLTARTEAANLVSFGIGRGLGVAAVAVYPLEVDKGNHVTAMTKIVVRVDFVPDPKAAVVNKTLALSRKDDPQGLAANIINYKQIAPYCPVRGEVRAQPENSPLLTPRSIPRPAYKIYVKDQGMVRINGTWLVNNGIDLADLNPENIKVYGSDGDPLPEDGTFAPKSITELPLDVHDGGDGRFDPEDWFTFYGYGTYYLDENLTWHRNPYTDYNVYWLSLGGGPGLRMSARDVTPNADPPASTFHDKAFGEQDISYWGVETALNTGNDVFYWAYSTIPYNLMDRKYFLIPTPGTSHSGTAHLSAELKGIATSSVHHTYIYVNTDVDNPSKLIYEKIWYGTALLDAEVDFPGSLLTSDTTQIMVKEVNASSDQNSVDKVLYNYFRVAYDSRYEARSDRLLFLSPNDQPTAKTYLVTGISSPNTFLYEVKSGEILTNFETDTIGSVHNVRFTDTTGGKRRYALAAPGRFVLPVGIRLDRSTQLPDDATEADIIYIVSPKYEDRLDPLVSFRRSQGWHVVQVLVDDVCNEYSAGLLDPTAIRNFLQHAYTSWQGSPPSMVGLVGDCTYDFREIINKNAHPDLYASWGWNDVPTHYIITNGVDANTATDNWFVCFDGPSDTAPEMGISRISPDTISELDHMVNKFVAFEQNPDLGDWRMYNAYIADNNCIDEEGEFTWDAENFFRDELPVGQSSRKMYLESVGFPEDWIIHEGHQADRQVMARNNFTPIIRSHFDNLITQFGGHGSRQLWTHERILWERIGTTGVDIRDIETLENLTRYPFIFMLSCSTCEYDDPPEVVNVVGSGDSLGEYFTRIPEHGGIAAWGSSRLSQEPNCTEFQQAFYQAYFPGRTLPTNPLTLGQGFWMAKVLMTEPAIRVPFAMMGDPATVLPIPRLNVVLTPESTSVARGGLLNVSGVVSDTSFQGKAEVFLEDTVFYYNSEELSQRVVKPRRMSIAMATVNNGRFNATLPIPTNAAPLSDITKGIVRTYVWNDQTKIDGCNRLEPAFDIQGLVPSEDRDGPLISIGLTDGPFRDGDTIASQSRFLIRFSDPSGMLIAMEGDPLNPTNHPIQAIISGSSNQSIDCTGLYVPDADNYQMGTVEFPVALSAGSYTLTMVAADSRGNQSQKTVTFFVGSGLNISNPLVCPDPVINQTYFTFNLSNYATSGKVSVYTVSGRLVRTLETGTLRAGYNEIGWDARDSRGNRLANGCYFYVLTVRVGNSKSVVKGKFLVMR